LPCRLQRTYGEDCDRLTGVEGCQEDRKRRNEYTCLPFNLQMLTSRYFLVSLFNGLYRSYLYLASAPWSRFRCRFSSGIRFDVSSHQPESGGISDGFDSIYSCPDPSRYYQTSRTLLTSPRLLVSCTGRLDSAGAEVLQTVFEATTSTRSPVSFQSFLALFHHPIPLSGQSYFNNTLLVLPVVQMEPHSISSIPTEIYETISSRVGAHR
jgi:hypothetical protein